MKGKKTIMQLIEAIETRRSIRGFLPKPVSQDTLRQVLALATRAMSANNIQPWSFWVATGDCLDKIRQYNIEDLRAGLPTSDYIDVPMYGEYRRRGKSVGKQLFTAMGIERDNWEKRIWWSERGYRFFEAPAAIFVCIDRQLPLKKFSFDLGCVTQNLCLAALEFGLGTCVEDQAIIYQRGLRQVLALPENQQAVVGIAIGYPDPDFPANGVMTQRDPVDDITVWVGF